jgi:hypothetical protein
MEEQRIVVFLLDGVRTAMDALGLETTVIIGDTECQALLPVKGRWPMFLAGPPAGSGDGEEDPGWPRLESGAWGENLSSSAIIRSVGIILKGTRIPPGDEHIEFDHAAARWRQLLRDWLAVAAEGPTDWAQDYYGATAFGPGYDGDYDGEDVPYKPPQHGHRHPPRQLSAWAWTHALEHASAGVQPPLAQALMTTATQAAVAANWRVAIIDAATATEAALTAGLAARLSATLSPSDVQKKLKDTRMLGNRIKLAKTLNMMLPARIQEDLVYLRNDVIHESKDMTCAQTKEALKVAWTVVHQYAPLDACCQEPESP